ncbi:MAG: FtsX-like permease family protein [Bdellovibrionaceae bacterium]|nr:FtsX-like permease family protein [Pseudobdellovibrionaceae bacterium]
MWLSLALKELRHSWKQMSIVALILTLGFVGPLIAVSLQSSAQAFLRLKSREFLSADLALASQRPISDAEIEKARTVLSPRRWVMETEFVTMASKAGESSRADEPGGRASAAATLVSVHAVDPGFPIYGEYRVRTATSGPSGEVRTTAELSQERRAWVFSEVLVQLGIAIGERVRIGEAEFAIAGEILDGPGVLRAGFSLAPRVYIGRSYVAATGLTNYGSQIFHRAYFELDPRARIEDAGTVLKAALPDPDLFLRTPDDSIQGMERFIQFFGRYLAVITLIVFALSWMSAFYILEIFLTDRLRPAAILMTLGASRAWVGGIQIVQLALVSLFSLATGLVIVAVVLFAANRGLSGSWPEGLVLSIHGADVARLFLIALLSSCAFTVPLLIKLSRLQPRALLDETSMGADIEPSSRALRVFYYLPLVILFWALSVWLMDSWMQGTGLLAALLGTTWIGWMLGRGLFRAWFALLRGREGLPRLAATNLARGRFGTSLCFLALTLMALVLNLVPHLLKSTLAELRPQEGRDLPSLFLFNIPEGEAERLTHFTSEHGAELRYVSPLILARLEKVNGREPKQESFQKFPVRLSFRDKLIPSETIVNGPTVPGVFDAQSQGIPAISMEVRFAERNDFSIGDRLEFDVQGVPVEGRIANLRRVKWTDFHPNFFMEFQSGVLDDAPKTFVANVNLKDPSAQARFQYDLIREFPDLSIVDIGRSINKVMSLADAMIGPIQAVAWVAVIMSLVILFIVVSHNLQLRARELDVMKLLGANPPLIRAVVTMEYAVIGTFAALSGGGFALVTAAAVATRIFDIQSQVSWNALGLSFFVIVSVASAIAALATQRTLNRAEFAAR